MRIKGKSVGTDDLSPQAQKLVELVYDQNQPMSQVLRENLDLMDGVDEYVAWYGNNQAAIAHESEKPPAGHTTKQIVERLKRK